MTVTEAAPVERLEPGAPGGEGAGPGRRNGGGRWRRRLGAAAAVLLVLALIGGAVGFQVYRLTYQPLRTDSGFSFGPRGGLEAISDGYAPTYMISTGPPGTPGTFGFPIENVGSHPVEVTNATPASQVTERWSPVHAGHDTYVVDTTYATARPFPMHLGAGQQAVIFVQVTRPACQPGESWGLDTLGLVWHALGVHHVLVQNLSTPNQTSALPVLLCWPRSVLSHVVADG